MPNQSLKAFLKAHPWCAFCGGATPSTTREHCPPQAMFKTRQAPDDLEFPACFNCNHPTTDDDLLIAWLGRIDPEASRGDDDGRLPGLMNAMHQQFPDLLPAMLPSAREARKINARRGQKPAHGETHQQTAGSLKVTDEVELAICTVGRKLAKGLYYREQKVCLPNDGCILMMWETAVRSNEGYKFDMVDAVQCIKGSRTPPVLRNRQSLRDQFTYHVAHDTDDKVLMIGARFRSAFGMLLYASGTRGRLESAIADSKSSAGYVLQSPIIPLHPLA